MRFWEFIRRPSNQRLLAWFGAGAVVLVGGIWSVVTYVWPAHEGPTVVCTDQGIAIGGNVSGSTISNTVSGGTATWKSCLSIVSSPPSQVTDTLSSLKTINGLTRFDAPKSMSQGDTSDVEVSVATNQLSEDALKAAIAAIRDNLDESAPRQHGTKAVEVSEYMTATLHGAGFSISPKEAVRQKILADKPTTWVWQITAEHWGDELITLTLNAELTAPDGRAFRLTTIEQPIKVRVSAMTIWHGFVAFVHDARYVAIAFFLPVGAVVWRFWKKKFPNAALVVTPKGSSRRASASSRVSRKRASREHEADQPQASTNAEAPLHDTSSPSSC